MELATGASGLRQELRDKLAALQSLIRADGSQGIELHRAQTRLAELSAMRHLVLTSLWALKGDAGFSNGDGFLDVGSIRDCQDAVSIAGRELQIQKDEADAALKKFEGARFDNASMEFLQKISEAEDQATRTTEQNEADYCNQMQQGLAVCARDICEVLCASLLQAAPSGTSTAQRLSIANDASERISKAASSWLAWFRATEPQRPQPAHLTLPSATAHICMQVPGLGAYVQALRHHMRLRRQQARMLGIMRRISSAVQISDAGTVMRSRIVFPMG